MTWGTHCPQCGREDCGWIAGDYCEGNTPRPPDGYRIRPAELDFVYGDFFFYIERLKRGWFFKRWVEVEGCRADNPDTALALLLQQLSLVITGDRQHWILRDDDQTKTVLQRRLPRR